MKDLAMKQKVMQEIMDLMDEKDGERLLSHPNAKKKAPAAPVVESDELEEDLDSAPSEEEELTPEMIAKLLEMANGE